MKYVPDGGVYVIPVIVTYVLDVVECVAVAVISFVVSDPPAGVCHVAVVPDVAVNT